MSHVSIKNLGMTYGRQTVLERINLEIPSGEFCAVVGPSGCGKTTFLRLLLAMERPTRGEILLDGAALPPEPGPDRGVVFQRYSVFPHLTVLGNALLGLEAGGSPVLGRLRGRKRRAAITTARDMLACVGLSDALHHYPSELSGGMQQRLSIAQALVKKPKILLMDEPFGALDSGTRAQMHDLIRGLWREVRMNVFMVTHDVKEAFALATRVLTLDKVRNEADTAGNGGATVVLDLPLDRKAERGELIQNAADSAVLRRLEAEASARTGASDARPHL